MQIDQQSSDSDSDGASYHSYLKPNGVVAFKLSTLSPAPAAKPLPAPIGPAIAPSPAAAAVPSIHYCCPIKDAFKVFSEGGTFYGTCSVLMSHLARSDAALQDSDGKENCRVVFCPTDLQMLTVRAGSVHTASRERTALCCFRTVRRVMCSHTRAVRVVDDAVGGLCHMNASIYETKAEALAAFDQSVPLETGFVLTHVTVQTLRSVRMERPTCTAIGLHHSSRQQTISRAGDVVVAACFMVLRQRLGAPADEVFVQQ